jgi:hypothetical protein
MHLRKVSRQNFDNPLAGFVLSHVFCCHRLLQMTPSVATCLDTLPDAEFEEDLEQRQVCNRPEMQRSSTTTVCNCPEMQDLKVNL